MFETLFATNQQITTYNPIVIVFNLLLALVLAVIIAQVYKKTHKGLSYSQTFVNMLILAGIVIAAVMMVIGSDIARAFGAFGAFSLVRFRTAIKDARDMGFIFLVLAVGMAVGTNNYLIAIATTIVTLVVMFVLHRTNFGSIRRFDYVLSFNLDTKASAENVYKKVFDKHLKSNSLLNIKAIGQGHTLQMSFSISFITESDSQSFITELEAMTGVSNVSLITAKNDVEY